MAIPRFIGRNTELQQIKDCWKRACEGQPQVVNLVADTGVGKTRLVQSFYEWLSTDPEQGDGVGSQGYWPDDLGTGRQRVVNPPLERFATFDLKKSRISWLWWGLYWTGADGEDECALGRFEDVLETHLKMLELERRCRLNNWETLSEVAKDEALGFVADLIPGGGQVKNVIGLAKRLYTSLQERKDAKRGVAEDHKSQQEAIAEDILVRLQAVFNPNQRDVPRVPMVLFLDDVHFATDVSRDDYTLQFLDRLLRQAAREQWPLLVLTTHWKGPWQAHSQSETLEQCKPWRRIVMDMEVEPRKKTPDFHTLMLSNIPRDDLQSIILDLLPGLDSQDQDRILDRVDNVRWLIEVISALGDYAENFKEKYSGSALSDNGRGNLEDLLKTSGYLAVIRKRLAGDAMRDVRAVLGATAWHAHQLEFLSPLACAFGNQLVGQETTPTSDIEPSQQVLDILMRALDPAALLEGHGDGDSVPTLVSFPERGYLEIAKALFDTKRLPGLRLALGHEIIDWMQDLEDQPPRWKNLEDVRQKKAFLEIALAVMEKLKPQLSEEQQEVLAATDRSLRRRLAKGKITEEELQEELQETYQELLEEAEGPQLDEASRWHAVAMAELIHILSCEGNGRAWTLAFELAEHPQLPAVLKGTKFLISVRLIDLWREKEGCLPQARTWLDVLIQRQKVLLEAEETPEHLRFLKISLDKRASLYEAEGNFEQARADYRRSLEVTERLMAEYGETPELLQDLMVTQSCLGECFPLSITEEEFDLMTEEKQLEVLFTSNDYPYASEITEKLLGVFGETPKLLIDGNISDILLKYGKTPDHLHDLSMTLKLQADLDWRDDNIERARAGYQRSLEIMERLIEEFGETPDRLNDLSSFLVFLADLEWQGGNIDRARGGYQRILEVTERLLIKFGETSERLEFLARIVGSVVSLDKEAGDISRALSGYQRRLDIEERLLEGFGETPSRLSSLALTLACIAALERDAGNITNAGKYFQRSLELTERSLAEFGDNMNLRLSRAVTLEALNKLDIEGGDIDKAHADVKYRQ